MVKAVFPVLLACLASPALAHEGAHLHPHGIEAGWALLAAGLAVAALIAGGVRLALRARR